MPATPMAGGSHPGPRPLRLAELLILSDQTDENGRLLLEDSASGGAQKRARRSGVAMVDRTCDYADSPSRGGGRMNVSAYEALRHDGGAVLDGFAWLAEFRATSAPATDRASLAGLVDVANLGSTLPQVLFHRRPMAVAAHGALPSFIASVFKASRGLFSGAVAMANDSPEPNRVVTAAEVMGYAEGHGQFRRRQTGRVCAAPSRLIERTIDAVLTGTGADSSRSRLGAHVDPGQLWEFFSLHDSLSQSMSTYRFVLDGLSQAHPGAAPDDLFALSVEVGGRRGSFGDLSAALAHTATLTQARMNAVLGRPGDAAPVTVERLFQIL